MTDHFAPTPLAYATAIPRPLKAEVQREAVLKQLADLHDVSLVALLAPAGYGKTTVLAQYARQVQQNAPVTTVVWLRLDDQIACLKHFAERVVEQLLQISDERVGRSGRNSAKRQALTDPAVLAKYINRSETSVLLVIDRVGMLNQEGGRWIEQLVAGLRAGHQVLISGYPSLQVPLARMVARGQAAIIDQDQLAFSAQEMHDLTRHTVPEAHRLVETLAGWPMALALQGADRRSVLGTAQLIAEGVAELPELLRVQLPDLAPCHLWSEAFVRASGLELPSGWLDVVLRYGLPLTPLGGEVFLPHRQLVKWLRQQLEVDPARARLRYRQVADAYLVSGQPIQAVSALLDSGETDQSVEAQALITSHMNGTWDQTEFYTVMSTVIDEVQTRPADLRSQCAYALVVTGKCDEAQELLRRLPDSKGFEREAGLALLYRHTGKYPLMLPHLEAASLYEMEPCEVQCLRRLQITALLSNGQRKQAEKVCTREMNRLNSKGQERDELHLDGLHSTETSTDLHWQYIYLQTLPLEEFERFVHQAEHLSGQLQQSELSELWHMQVLPEVLNAYLISDRLSEANLLLQKMISNATSPEESENSDAQPGWGSAAVNMLCACGDVALVSGDSGLAAELYSQSWHKATGMQFALGCHQAAGRLADLAYLSGDMAQATAELVKIDCTSHPKDRVLQLYLFGVEAFCKQDQATAVEYFVEAAEIDIFSWYRWRALSMLRAMNDNRLVACPPPPRLPWLERLNAQQAGVLDSRQTNSKLESSSNISKSFSDIYPPALIGEPSSTRVRLTVSTFRRLEVLVAGSPVHFPFAKVAELFAYLLVQGPSSRAQIVDALWDGSRDLKHKEYFRVVVRRLRMALADAHDIGGHSVVFHGGHYALADVYEVSTDIQVIDFASYDSSPDTLKDAWAVYDGDFLPTIESDWAETRRTDFRERLIQASLGYAAQQADVEGGNIEEAYKQVLRIDRMNEAAHIGLIQLHFGQGRQELARHLYQQYERLLSDEYADAPPLAIRKLFPELVL